MDARRSFQNGEYAEGAFNATEGAANLACGGFLVAGRIATGGAVGGGVAVVDGGREICHGVQRGDGEQVGVGAVKSLGGGMMLSGSVTGQPEVVATGAVMYGGAVVYENRREIAQAARKAEDSCAEKVKSGFVATEDWLTRHTSAGTQQKVLENTPKCLKSAYFTLSDWMHR